MQKPHNLAIGVILAALLFVLLVPPYLKWRERQMNALEAYPLIEIVDVDQLKKTNFLTDGGGHPDDLSRPFEEKTVLVFPTFSDRGATADQSAPADFEYESPDIRPAISDED